MSDTIAAEQLRLFIKRVERLGEEKKGMNEDVRDIYNEAKGRLRRQDDAGDRPPA